jgi:pimeloyl-ACP methyl ester carboxylesterase
MYVCSSLLCSRRDVGGEARPIFYARDPRVEKSDDDSLLFFTPIALKGNDEAMDQKMETNKNIINNMYPRRTPSTRHTNNIILPRPTFGLVEMKTLVLLLVVLVSGATAFSHDGRISPGRRRLTPSAATTTTRTKTTTMTRRAVASASTEDASTDEDNTAEDALGKFVVAMRDMYGDLKDGGGSIRRRMNGVGFTYISPPSVASAPVRNGQLGGAWRDQIPMLVGVDEDMSDGQRGILRDRFMMAPHSSTPPPLLVYLPGLDGFGISATAQFDDLSSSFEFWRMTVDHERTQLSFSDLVVSVVKFVKESASIMGSNESPREVIIVGESFGGLLACAVAMALKNGQSNTSCYTLKGMVLVNPATSFDETIWESVVPVLSSLRYLESQDEVTEDSENSRPAFLNGLPTLYSVIGGVALAATVPSGKVSLVSFHIILILF